MARQDKIKIDTTAEQLFEVRQTALALAGQNDVNIDDVFFMDNLVDVETNIKKLNEYSDKCWLLSSILLYSLIYDKEMYTQSGLSWQEYVAESKKRLGLSRDDISRQLSGARFFIQYHGALQRAGWTPTGNARKLASAQIALELCGDIDEVIQHLIDDSWRDFQSWYSSFKLLPPVVETPVVDKRPDIVIKNHVITINNVQAVTISEELPKDEKEQLQKYLETIYETLKRGDVPAIVPVYDDNEARTLVRLRDKNRQGK